MDTPSAFNQQSVFEEVVERGIEEGVADLEAFGQLIENVLDRHLNWGEMHDDNDLEGLEDILKARFSEYMERYNAQVA